MSQLEPMTLADAVSRLLPIILALGRPGMRDIERATGLPERTARWHVGQLVKHGYLERASMGRGARYKRGTKTATEVPAPAAAPARLHRPQALHVVEAPRLTIETFNLVAVERQVISAAVASAPNLTAAAAALGLSMKGLRLRLDRYGIEASQTAQTAEVAA